MKQLEFKGSGFEYFKIWIVNLLLTLITFGIYYPWARVRNNRYLYANSTMQDKSFNYHATGMQLLVGYLIAASFILLYNVLELISTKLSLIMLAVFFCVIPWLIWRSMRFNLNVTSFNNVRFKFDGQLSHSYIIFLLIPILSLAVIALVVYLITLFNDSAILVSISVLLILFLYLICFSYFNVIKTRYLIDYTSYGESNFDTNIDTPEFIKIVFKTMLIAIITFIASLLITLLLAYLMGGFNSLQAIVPIFSEDPNAAIALIFQLLFPIIIIGYFLLIIANVLAIAFYVTRLRAYVFENTNIEKDIFFESSMKFLPYASLLITNTLLIIFTLGLAYPWAKVRVIKYTLENTSIYAKNGFDGYLNPKYKDKSGFADQASDTLDIDIGIPL